MSPISFDLAQTNLGAPGAVSLVRAKIVSLRKEIELARAKRHGLDNAIEMRTKQLARLEAQLVLTGPAEAAPPRS